MGYYTDFKLTMDAPGSAADLADTIVEDLTGVSAYPWECHDDKTLILDDAKWYNHEQDMRALSKLYPEALFTLSACGEENGDIWKAYFKNGKMQHCTAIITFEEFDESKMK